MPHPDGGVGAISAVWSDLVVGAGKGTEDGTVRIVFSGIGFGLSAR